MGELDDWVLIRGAGIQPVEFDTMRAVGIKNGKGSADALFIDENVAKPESGSDRLLVKIHSFGINRMDLMQREGHYPLPPQAGPILGVEFSGVVEETKHGFKQGDEVFGLAYGGAYAEYIAAFPAMLIHKPKNLSFEDAAGIPEVWITAIQALFQVGSFKNGMRCLFHAGASGVGQALIQLAKTHGAEEIYATAGTDEKCRLVEKLGAKKGINYKTQDFAAEIDEATGGKGVDFIVDFIVGGGYWEKNLKVAARDGEMVILALMGGFEIKSMDARPILLKRLTVHGSTLRARTPDYQKILRDKLESEALSRFVSGEFNANVEKVYDWKDIVQVHKYMESNASSGRLICRVL